MRTPTIAVSTAGVAAAVLVLSALTGCGSKSPGGSSGLTNVNASASTGVPSGGSTPPVSTSGGPTSATTATPTPKTTGATGGGTTGGGSTTTKVTYPTTQAAYAKAALNAYTSGNKTLLHDFVNAAAISNFTNLGHPDNHWHFHQCVGDGGNWACSFDNNNGDRLTIDVNPTYLAKPQAVNNASIDRTEFGMSADSQVSAFMQAWFDGNVQRMKILSTDNTATLIMNMTTPTSWTLSDDTTTKPGVTLVKAYLGGDSVVLQVTNSKLGKAHAISSGPAS